MKSENTVQRIKEYIDYKGISVRKFEESVGFSNGSFGSQYKNNKTIGVDKVEYILQTYNDINPAWLLTGEGSMLRSTPEPQPVRQPATQQDLSGEAAVYYKMYKEEKEEKEKLLKENGRLEERLRQLEASQSTSQDKRQSDEIALAFPSDSLEGSTKSSLPMRNPITSSERSSAGKI